jgi:nucleoside-diphosphate-sugar epimerase
MQHSELVLVTGGNGTVGIQCILQLLKKGYFVRTTLRTLNKKNEVIAMLKRGGINSFDNLSFVEADLTKDDNWDAAMEGCKYVLHVASPTHIDAQDESKLIGPAVDGVLRVLTAARNAGIKRVVLTSSFGALGFSHTDRSTPTTEADWTNPHQKGLSAYEKSKVLAERAAWDFIKTEGRDVELSVLNPVAIYGPSLGPNNSPSLGLLKMLLSGNMKAVPNIPLNVVDIRDVADLHIRAMETPAAAGERFIATAGGEISLPEIARLLKVKLPAVSEKVSLKVIPDWVLRIMGLFNPQAKTAYHMLQINRNVSNEKAKKILGWTPIANNETAILAAVETMTK